LFKQPPKGELLPESYGGKGQSCMVCCGKIICIGCVWADAMQSIRDVISGGICPFCRATAPDSVTDALQLLDKWLEVNNHYAFYDIGAYYNVSWTVVKNKSKAFEYFLHGAELGSSMASNAVPNAYNNGNGVKKDNKKAKH
jgi:TPR repeat protein